MIVGSLLLILVAVGLLGLGLVSGSNAFLIGSIAASLLAAILLIVGARRAAASRAAANGRSSRGLDPSGLVDTMAGQAEARDPRGGSDAREALRQAARGNRMGAAPGERDGALGDPMAGDTIIDEAPTQVFIPPQSRMGMSPERDLDDPDGEEFGGAEFGDEDPPDEPAAQVVSPQDAARVAQMSTEVLVIDGRPRYHHPACVHLLGRENEPLPVSEAVDLGFTPCGLCEPDAAMLAEARRA
ncbi:hypothetical protein [Rugosimonospora africana]|uniref:Clumping factor A n=1 Tax=Rugosimonospora africana TaxID=556532 RepID=A0A8J3QYV7_9ACTN|nr:hypothetical protein [Rugosimonospora africana]GIH19066.1 hypothetical protein Raf01_72380 [Rugosimonospora africana]